ncbi:MAG: hypothetical protein M3R63_19315 [Actinomycetota bacterium]|nr:hypothetical protein [Actinomycetota bacterium]
MSSPTPPSGLGPLNSAPVSLYPPFARPGGWDRYPTQAERYIALLTALDGVDVGSHDVRVLHWLAGWNPPTVATVCALLHRAHGAGYREGNTRSCPPPTPPPPHPPRGRPWWIPRP